MMSKGVAFSARLPVASVKGLANPASLVFLDIKDDIM